MTLVVAHSPHERCGVAQYGQQLDRSLARWERSRPASCFLGALPEPAHFASGDRLLVHFEPSLVGDAGGFRAWLEAVRGRGARLVFCCHYLTPEVARVYEGIVHRFVVHRAYPHLDTFPVTIIPLGAPLYEPTRPRDAIRQELGMTPADRVVTTVGFLSRWKQLPAILKAVAERLPKGWTLFAQTPFHFDPAASGAEEEAAKIQAICAGNTLPIRWSTAFTPEDVLLDLVHASDLGFVFHPEDTASVSAATKQFVSARCPLVVTDSTHARDLERGVFRSANRDPLGFAYDIAKVAADDRLRAELAEGIRVQYDHTHMDAVAKQFLDLFASLA